MAAELAKTNATVKESFAKGVESMSAYGGAGKGDRTMLDALLPAAEKLLDLGASTGEAEVFLAAARAAAEGAEATKEMKHAKAGRSMYVTDIAGHIDPGAKAVAVAMEALAKCV